MPLPWVPLTDQQLFSGVNAVLPAWVALALAPGWRWSGRLAWAAVLLMAAFYTGLMFMSMAPSESEGLSTSDFWSWQGVARLLSTPSVVLPAWVHYAAYNLFVGRWIAMDAFAHGIPRLLMAPVLFLACMFGPGGLLVYRLLVRPWFKRQGPPGLAGAGGAGLKWE